jgi:hypothetical protein
MSRPKLVLTGDDFDLVHALIGQALRELAIKYAETTGDERAYYGTVHTHCAQLQARIDQALIGDTSQDADEDEEDEEEEN